MGQRPKVLCTFPKRRRVEKLPMEVFRRGLRFRFGRSWARATGTQDPSSGALVPSGPVKRRSPLPRRSVMDAAHWAASPEPAGETGLRRACAKGWRTSAAQCLCSRIALWSGELALTLVQEAGARPRRRRRKVFAVRLQDVLAFFQKAGRVWDRVPRT